MRREDFARENVTLKRFWETWRVPVHVATVAIALFFVYSILRDSFAADLIIAADERIAELATKVAGLKGASASEDGVIRYISKQKKLVADREALKDTETLNSALDFMSRLAEKLPVEVPMKPGLGLEVSHLTIDGNDLTIEGRIQGAAGIAQITKALGEIARAKSVQKITPASLPAGPGTPFGFRMKIDRTK